MSCFHLYLTSVSVLKQNLPTVQHGDATCSVTVSVLVRACGETVELSKPDASNCMCACIRMCVPVCVCPSPSRYLPIGGLKDFVVESVKLAYGDDAACIKEGRVAAVQSLSGTGSCRLFADFQRK